MIARSKGDVDTYRYLRDSFTGALGCVPVLVTTVRRSISRWRCPRDPHPILAQLRQVLHSYYAQVVGDGLDEASPIHESHWHTGTSKNVLEEPIELWEYTTTIRCVDRRHRSREKRGGGEALDGTHRYLEKYVYQESEEG